MNRYDTLLPLVLCTLLLSLGQKALADAPSPEEVTFPQAPSKRLPVWLGYGERVKAVLTLPPNAKVLNFASI